MVALTPLRQTATAGSVVGDMKQVKATQADVTAKKQAPYISMSEVAKHTSTDAGGLWVAYKGDVYDVTEFAPDHPGGIEYLLEYAGTDITHTLFDDLFHLHSDTAVQILLDYKIGSLPPSERTAEYATSDPTATDKATTEPFLDIHQPLVPQMLRNTFTKATYLEYVHKPRHLPRPARFFQNSVLEVFTRTPWYVVPIVWCPVILGLLYEAVRMCLWASAMGPAPLRHLKAAYGVPWLTLLLSKVSVPVAHAVDTLLDQVQAVTPLAVACQFLFGILFWTFIEYTVHRFVFHVEAMLPDHPYAFVVHFLMHGVHHYIPMDRYRLVMPPLLLAPLAASWYVFVFRAVGVLPTAYALFAGGLTGYVAYDLTHYYLHHGRAIGTHMQAMKTYHVAHHYKNANLGYGITSKLWDHLFNTVLPMSEKSA